MKILSRLCILPSISIIVFLNKMTERLKTRETLTKSFPDTPIFIFETSDVMSSRENPSLSDSSWKTVEAKSFQQW